MFESEWCDLVRRMYAKGCRKEDQESKLRLYLLQEQVESSFFGQERRRQMKRGNKCRQRMEKRRSFDILTRASIDVEETLKATAEPPILENMISMDISDIRALVERGTNKSQLHERIASL